MPTFEELRAKIQRNKPQHQQQPTEAKPLVWERSTMNTIVTTCGRFLIHKAQDVDSNTFDYSGYIPAGPHGPARKICGPFITPKECRDAVQDYVNGQPMQADLA